jgi:hypothetical protein
MMKFILFFIPILLTATGWPVGEMNKERPVGNSWGAIQTFEGTNYYLHPGIDVMGVTAGQPVYAVAPGIVKAWVTIYAEFHWRLAIADSETNDSCDGWLYAHIDPSREHKELGDWVETGDLIGYLVPWPGGFNHLHWARIRGYGSVWTPDWRFIDNPWPELSPKGDTLPPLFKNALADDLLAFRENNSLKYLSPDSLYGDVDIIARVEDRTGTYWEDIPDTGWENLALFEASYEIHGQKSKGLIRSFIMYGALQEIDQMVDVIYSCDEMCHSSFPDGYSNRKYYYVLTNTDGDSIRELSDYDSCWHTAEYPDGYYEVVVHAKDAAGNTSKDSMQVRLINGNIIITEGKEELKPFEFISPLILKDNQLSVISRTRNTVRICDATGRVLLTTNLAPATCIQNVSLEKFPAGVYFVGIKQGTSEVRKFVKLN